MLFDSLPPLLAGFLTILLTMFIVELTDKDALLLLALATKISPWTVFASGALAFTITTSIIVTVGYVLIQFVPVWIVKLAGGVIMIGFALWNYFAEKREEKEVLTDEQKILRQASRKNSRRSVFIGAVLMLIVLDLAGDATEILTIVYVAQFQNALLVFSGCVVALVAASGVETLIGNRLGKLLSMQRIRYFSLAIFLIIGSITILTTLLPKLIPAI